ncbi:MULTISPECIES: ABC transporter permease subunit [Paenibacillus]|uniref:Sugar ABC transporter permease n=1 Tax=Paenibacillus glycanilyticus TaxID=126569 RepID=A0ABQ6NV27_9BACL|nr:MULTISPECIES: ABC transporter permease subunit [Paenibacillus]MCK9861729.1 ABC transporter permease subunit [Paenibacillus sp. ATY16]TCM97849.1 putative aldouronate transport system permease protein [Paenibacillus sp. BK033]GMK48946.1 sugar ABC transporter permease [Paenibacillus glycanilyticus]
MANAEAAPLQATGAKTRKGTRKRTLTYLIRNYWMFYLMLLPGVLLLIFNNYIPMLGIVIAFKSVRFDIGILNSPWAGLTNFKFLFQSSDSYIIIRNTLLYNSAFIVLNLIFPLAFALMLNEMKNRFLSKLHQTIMFLPYFLSMTVIAYLVYGFMSDEHGYLNGTLLPALGLDSVRWYFTKEVWPFVLPLINTWKSMGYYTVVYMAAIIGIDDEYYEAATIDGASKWQQMTSITIPLIMPVITIMTLLQIGRIFNADFGLFFQVPRESGTLFPVTNVIDTYVYRTFLTVGDIGLSSAAGLFQSVVGFTLVFLSNWVVRRINSDNALF